MLVKDYSILIVVKNLKIPKILSFCSNDYLAIGSSDKNNNMNNFLYVIDLENYMKESLI
jgi:hypothetical protein